MFLIEIADRVDETHGGFAAIHDSYTLKSIYHKPSDQQIVRTKSPGHSTHTHQAATVSNDIASCIAFNPSTSTAPGTATVR